MKPLPVALGAFALLSLVGAFLLFRSVAQQRDDVAARLQQTQERVAAIEASQRRAEEETAAAERRASGLSAELQEARARAAAADTRAQALSRDLATTQTEAATHQAAAQQLQQDVAALKREILQERLAAVSPEELDRQQQRIQELDEQVAELAAALAAAETRLAAAARPPAPPAVQAQVVGIGPMNSFVVLDYGTSRGASVTQQLLIQRGGDRLATVQISDVRENHSIAQVHPASLLGSIRDGDSATLLP